MDDNITPTSSTVNSSAQNTTDKETLVFNVGGVTLETYRSTLHRIPNSPLTNSDFLEEHYRPERKEYFFDRDPDAFKIVLDFLRTGQLYIPMYVDRPSVRNDLLFWGLTSSVVQQTGGVGPVQPTTVNSGNTVSFTTTQNASIPETTSMKLWNILSNPSTSLPAQLYAALTYILMFVSMFILVFGTTSLFRVTEGGVYQVLNSTVYDSYYVEYNVLEERGYESRNHISIFVIALVINVFFTVEYILRIILAPNRVRFAFSFLGVIDFLAVIPEYIFFILSEFFEGPRPLLIVSLVFRILRVLRVFKHFKNLINTNVFVRTVKASAGELSLVGGLFAIGTLISATVIFVVEGESSLSHFRSIPDAFWWAIITLTTVGYGDMRPVTVQGKVIGAFTALFGLVMIGFLVAVLINSFLGCSRRQVQGRTQNLHVAHGHREVAECRPLIATSSGGENAQRLQQ